jgi:putative transposase
LSGKTTVTKTTFAQSSGISRTHLYYRHRLPEKDWKLKQHIELVLREYPSYGHKRIALKLSINRKRILRVMKLFGIKPYRRRGRKFRKTKSIGASFPNLLLTEFPRYPHHIWASDFTHISFHGRIVYIATVIDLFTREVAGFSVMTTHSVSLVINALFAAIHTHPHPAIIHSDHGSEYTSKDYVALNEQLGITMSMSKKASPWENGYQESFYSQFKVDLGDPNRFQNLGELVYAIYQTVHSYNHRRIHTKLKMPPAIFAAKHQRSKQLLETVS